MRDGIWRAGGRLLFAGECRPTGSDGEGDGNADGELELSGGGVSAAGESCGDSRELMSMIA